MSPGIIVEPLGPLLVGVVPWAHQRPVGPARHFLTVVAKVTLTRVHRGDCRIVTPEPLADDDRSPILPRGEVTLHGTSPSTGRSALIHLRVSRDGREIGVRRASIDVVGSIADLSHLGPRSPDAPERVALLRGVTAPRVEDGVVAVPSGLDASYFQTAPLDQRFDGLRGDEVIEIDGLGDPPAPLVFRLPRLHATAYVYNLAPQPTHVALAVDTVRIALPAERVTVLMRGSCAVGSRQSFDGLAVAARLESPVTGPAFPHALGARAPSRPPAAAMTVQLVQTAQLGEPVIARSPLPFDPTAPRGVPAPRRDSAPPAPAQVRVTRVDEPPISSGPVTLAPHTARIDGAAPPPALPFIHEEPPKSRRGTRSKTKPEGDAAPPSARGGAKSSRGPRSARAPRVVTEPIEPVRVAPPAFVATPFVARPAPVAPPAPAMVPPPFTAPLHAPARIAEEPEEEVSPPTKRESQLPPAPTTSPLPAAAAEAVPPPPLPPDPRGRGLLARGRGADFLRALRAVDEERRG